MREVGFCELPRDYEGGESGYSCNTKVTSQLLV